MAEQNAPKPGCGVRALYHYYRQLRPTPAHYALRAAREQEGPQAREFWGLPPAAGVPASEGKTFDSNTP